MSPADARPRPGIRHVLVGPDSMQTAAELALLGVTITALVGMHLLFADGSFLAPLALQAFIAHVAMGVLRRLRFRLLTAAGISLVVAVLSITWTQYLETALVLLPTSDTWSTIDTDMNQAWQLFQEVRAPAPVVAGFIVTTSMAVWVIVFIADWGAFRTGVSFEALLPPATLFLFAAVLGDQGGSRAPGAALFVAAALLFLLLHRTWRQEGTATWAAVSLRTGRGAMLTTGAALAAIPVVASVIIGPNLPGADEAGIIAWRELTEEEDPRVVVSPLVDIRSRLVEQANMQVFEVETNRPFEGSYWRLTALDSFDGTIWRSSYDTDNADGRLPSVGDAEPSDATIEQTITIQALEAIWLPAAYRPTELDMERGEADFDRDSATLIVDKETRSSDGLVYTITSEIPRWTDEQLRAASPEIPDEIRDRYLELPEDFSDQIRSQADRVTQGQETAYDQAMALQNYFRNEFTYDAETVRAGHDEDALEDFLFTTKAGYCEQFAGAFAAMARHLGLPTRVAVGFTAGQQDRNQPTIWVVTGRQAHAWVEVWFAGLGWVTFEPTPGRGPQGGQAWLGGLEPQQDTPPEVGAPNSEVPAETPGPVPNPGGPPAGDPDLGEINTGGIEVPTPPASEDPPPFDPPEIKAAARSLGFGLLIYLAIVPVGLLALPYIRRMRARQPRDKVELAWRESIDQAAESGVRLPDSLTVAERALRMRAAMPHMAEQIDLVALWVEQVHYAETLPTPEQAAEASRAAASVVAAAARRQPWHTRLLRYLDARRLVPKPSRARRSAHEVIRPSTAN